MTSLRLTRFGNPILRQQARYLTTEEIKSGEIQRLITDMFTLNEVKQGVGLAAPQVGKNNALCIIDIRPTKLRPNAKPFRAVIINPTYTGIGRRVRAWEGCLSSGRGKDVLFGQALRYGRVRAEWLDEYGEAHKKELTGLPAHVFQHETDHLKGILFVDLVPDSTSFMLADEYRKRILGARNGL